jgi:enterochelin esterase family protein
VVGGYSAGGFAADYAALRHPEVFGNVLSQSGAVWWSPGIDIDNRDTMTETDWMAKQYIVKPKLPLRFYLDAGAFEADTHGRGGDVLEANRNFRDVLLAKGYPVYYQQFIGGHDGVSWRGTIADGLIDLLGTGR